MTREWPCCQATGVSFNLAQESGYPRGEEFSNRAAGHLGERIGTPQDHQVDCGFFWNDFIRRPH